jgi:hypothetical protein
MEESVSHYDALTELRSAGHPVDLLNEAQQGVFARLGRDQVRVLNELKRELDAVSGEVEGQEIKIL